MKERRKLANVAGIANENEVWTRLLINIQFSIFSIFSKATKGNASKVEKSQRTYDWVPPSSA